MVSELSFGFLYLSSSWRWQPLIRLLYPLPRAGVRFLLFLVVVVKCTFYTFFCEIMIGTLLERCCLPPPCLPCPLPWNKEASGWKKAFKSSRVKKWIWERFAEMSLSSFNCDPPCSSQVRWLSGSCLWQWQCRRGAVQSSSHQLLAKHTQARLLEACWQESEVFIRKDTRTLGPT